MLYPPSGRERGICGVEASLSAWQQGGSAGWVPPCVCEHTGLTPIPGPWMGSLEVGAVLFLATLALSLGSSDTKCLGST